MDKTLTFARISGGDCIDIVTIYPRNVISYNPFNQVKKCHSIIFIPPVALVKFGIIVKNYAPLKYCF